MHVGTKELQNILTTVRDLPPDTIRARLLEIEAEEKALRVLLRVKSKGQVRTSASKEAPCK
jgi:hypothetical protein